jgi:hypothetical protein
MCLRKLQVSSSDMLVLNKRGNTPEIHNLDSYCREKIYTHIKISFPHFDKFFNVTKIILLKDLEIKQFQNLNNILS